MLVIGAGYTGLMAARETAKGGRSTLVIDAESAGWGCSSRNGGQVATSIKPSFTALSGRHNEETAFAIRTEGLSALEYIDALIREEKLECDWRRVGRFHAAHNRRQCDALARFAGNQPKGLEVPMLRFMTSARGFPLLSTCWMPRTRLWESMAQAGRSS